MVSIRSNFFYTRTVPCELWHFDKGKPAERRDRVLMVDARNLYRKVTRKIYDFSPEQLANLTAIVWLYRGQRERFLALVRDYFERVCAESAGIAATLDAFDRTAGALRDGLGAFARSLDTLETTVLPAEKRVPFTAALAEWREAATLYAHDRDALVAMLAGFGKDVGRSLPETNAAQHAARKDFDPLAERLKGLVKQVDLLYKLAARAGQLAGELAGDSEAVAGFHDRRATNKRFKQWEGERRAAVEQLKLAGYHHRQIVWLQDRFPDAELCAVPGLVKVVSREEIKAADWSLTPGRYVGVAPVEVDEDFDFEQAMRDIHVEVADLDNEAIELAKKIQANFSDLIV